MTAPTIPYAKLRVFYEMVDGMLADPGLNGDLLLLGIYMARRYVDEAGETNLGVISELAFGAQRPATVHFLGQRHISNPNHRRMRSVVENDIRRYDYRIDPDNPPITARCLCGAPMIRRDSACGKPAVMETTVVRLETGQRLRIGACRRHEDWYDATDRASREQVKALGDAIPQPPANAGGLLRKHLPMFRWEDYWRKLQPTWVAPPEAEPIVRPALQLVVTDDYEAEPEPAPTGRPALRLVPGAGVLEGARRRRAPASR
jgi:hypothetical protein